MSLLKGSSHFSANEIIQDNESLQVRNETIYELDPDFSITETAESKVKEYTVLIVEDNSELREFLVQSLKDKYDIIQSVDGVDGWNKATSLLPDLIVSDLTMPEMNGIDLCKKI
ncbi:MAG: response regulator, partial [Pedobacter sp.]